MEALSTIFDLLRSEIAEKEPNAEQQASLRASIDSLKTFIVSEIQETNDQSSMAMSERIGDLVKSDPTQLTTEDRRTLVKFLGSAEELERMQSERDSLQKTLDELHPRLEKIAERVEAQSREIQQLKSQPVPPPTLRVAEKSEDSLFGKDASEKDVAEKFAKMSPEEKALALVKLAQQQPISNLSK